MDQPVEHPFAQYVRTLGRGRQGSRSFTREEARAAMEMILRGDVEDLQLGAFLMLLRVKEETAEELAGFVEAARNVIDAPPLAVDLDWSSYAGKRRHMPWYLLAALTLANHGVRVFMHGSGGHTAGRLYTEQVLAELGLPPAENWDDVATQLAQYRLSFLRLGTFCPPLQRMIGFRNKLGLRSPVHTLSRLLNPLRAPYSMQSIFHPGYAHKHQQAAQMLGQPHAAVFKGEGGEVERRPEARCQVFCVHDGALSEQEWPKLVEGKQETEQSLDSERLGKIWRGELTDEYGELAVTGTLAIALALMQRAEPGEPALRLARQWWRDRDTGALPRAVGGS